MKLSRKFIIAALVVASLGAPASIASAADEPANKSERPQLPTKEARKAAKIVGDELTGLFVPLGTTGTNAVTGCHKITGYKVACRGRLTAGNNDCRWRLITVLSKNGRTLWTWFTELDCANGDFAFPALTDSFNDKRSADRNN